MVLDRFGMILEEIGRVLEIPNLVPDQNNCCLIRFKGNVEIQLEIDKQTREHLIICTDFGEIPSGRYRENVFVEALKANGLPSPRNGIFAYSTLTNHLVMFERLHLSGYRGDEIGEIIQKFLAKTKLWKEALARGSIPQVTEETVRGGSSGIFGLKP